MTMESGGSRRSRSHGGDVVAVIPRVNIHAFCTISSTVQAMQAAATDRRMARAHLDIQLGGIMAAVQVYGQQTPNLLMVESQSQRDMLLAELAQLAQVCAPTTKVIVIGHLNDVVLYRELIRQGVSEYLVAPLHQLQIIEAIAALYRDPKAEPLGRIIAFVGAKGGVGSSTLAHNFGWFLSRKLMHRYGHHRSRSGLRHGRPQLQPGCRRRASSMRSASPIASTRRCSTAC